MQMNTRTLAALDSKVVECVTNKDWLGALPLIAQFADGADGAALGAARWVEAWVRVTMDTRQVHIATELLQEALPLLDEVPERQAQALLVGFYLASLSHDSDLYEGIAGRARLILADTSPEVKPWHGRLLYRLACHWTGEGRDLVKAEATLRNSIDWHHRNTGPFDEQDRREYIGHSLAALAEVHLAQGQHSQAAARAREAQRFLEDGAPRYTLLRMQGLVAEANHQDAQALTTYQQGISDARDVCDWSAATECAAAWGRILRRLNEWGKLVDGLRPLVTDLIEAGRVAEAHRLQLIAYPPSRDLGALQYISTAVGPRLIADLVGACPAE